MYHGMRRRFHLLHIGNRVEQQGKDVPPRLSRANERIQINLRPARLPIYRTVDSFRAMSASLPPDQLEFYKKHADDNQQANLIATITLCLALPCIAVFLRFIARWRTRAGYKADDWLILLALVRILRPAWKAGKMLCMIDRHTASIGRYVHHHWSRYPLWRGQAHHFRQESRGICQGMSWIFRCYFSVF